MKRDETRRKKKQKEGKGNKRVERHEKTKPNDRYSIK